MEKSRDSYDAVSLSRRRFLGRAAVSAVAAAGVGLSVDEAKARERARGREFRWDMEADVVVIGAGCSGLCASIAARDAGASVIAVDKNRDIGGMMILSGGSVHLGGGHSLQRKLGLEDSADLVFTDWIRFDNLTSRYNDREQVRKFADENVATFEFLVENGVEFYGYATGPGDASTVPRQFPVRPWPTFGQVYTGSNGSGLARALERSARMKGVEILLRHRMMTIIREQMLSGRVLGISVQLPDGVSTANIRANNGVVVASGGMSGNVNFRRQFDPRVTEEYQNVSLPYNVRTADGELAAQDIGASLWGTVNQTSGGATTIRKPDGIGVRWGNPLILPHSPLFEEAGGIGVEPQDYQNYVIVNDVGVRFADETTEGFDDYLPRAFAWQGNPYKLDGGGPTWAIIDAEGVAREGFTPDYPQVDLAHGYFHVGATIAELASKIWNEFQTRPMPPRNLVATIERYNSFVDSGVDEDFGKPTPMYKIATPPFYALWNTCWTDDTYTGLRTNAEAEVIDRRGKKIEGLYCAGESQGGFAQHGLGRCAAFGRIAGMNAARA
jgi:hypothetical protein